MTTTIKHPTHRLVFDHQQWVIQRWMPPRLIDQGRWKGRMSEGRWVDWKFYLRLTEAAPEMLDLALKGGLKKGGVGGEEVIAALKEAVEEVKGWVTDSPCISPPRGK